MTDERAMPAGLPNDEAEAFELTMTPRPEGAPDRGSTTNPLEAIEPLVVADPGDDELRGRYLHLAETSGEHLRAANVLARAAGANEPAVRERVWHDAGALFLKEAELPRARSAFLQAVLAGANGPWGLAAARRVIDLESEPGDPDALAPALDLIVCADPNAAARLEAAARLIALHAAAPQNADRWTHALRVIANMTGAEAVGSLLARLHEEEPERGRDVSARALEPIEPIEAGMVEPSRDRVGALMRAVAHFRRGTLGDLPGAAEAWRRLLEEEPGDIQAVEALVDLCTKADAAPDVLDVIARACPGLPGPQRRDLTLRTARALMTHGGRHAGLQMCRDLLCDPEVSLSTAHAIAEISCDENDRDLYRVALEFQIRVGGDETKKRALERLGDLQLSHLRDPAAAAESWRSAARICEGSPAGEGHAQKLYERVLDALPDDREAAQRLFELSRHTGDWAPLSVAVRSLIRTEGGESEAGRRLLDVESDAVRAGAVDDYVSWIDQLLARDDRDDRASADRVQSLQRARARALASDGARQAPASSAYRKLIEAFARDEDVRGFETFIDSRIDPKERHFDRRWLYAWRAGRDARPARALLDWARAEDEFGETDAALEIYQRVADTEPGCREALEALCRLKLHAGDLEGGLDALRSLRDAGPGSERRATILRMARLLLRDMSRPAEAALAVAPLLGVAPPIAEAHDILKRALADDASRVEVVDRLQRFAAEGDATTRFHIVRCLASARDETASMVESRERWFQEIVELAADPAVAFAAAIEGAAEFPTCAPLWDAAERIARALGQSESVSRAYHGVLVDGRSLDASVAEGLARRMMDFEASCGMESPRLVEALQKTLSVAPAARWALDRVKLVLGSQARWDDLFRLYDRAIAGAADEGVRASLLDEAAFAAKDLAALPERAITYLESIHRLRPEDPGVDSALERLYDKQGRANALIALLEERVGRCNGFQRREVLRKMATLWLEQGEQAEALAVIERILGESCEVAEVADLLERVAADRRPEAQPASPQPAADDAPPPLVAAQKRAISLLRAHYEGRSKSVDLVRMAERQLALARDADERAQCARELVRLRLLAAENDGCGIFERVISRVTDDVASDPGLATIAFESLLQRALQAWKQPASPARDDAAEGAWRTIHILKTLLIEDGKGEAAVHLLHRCSGLPFERSRRRELLHETALVCSETLADRARAIRNFRELFEEDGADEVAAKSLRAFAALLEGEGELRPLAHLWEEQAVVHAKRGTPAEARASWERAARLWERQKETDKAVVAYGEAGALGSQSAFEALAKIHSERGTWTDAAKALEWLVAHAEGSVRGLRALDLADAYVALGERGHARSCLESALSSGAGAESIEPVAERLIALYRDDADWQPLARLLAVQAKRPAPMDRKVAWLREAAEIHWRKLGQSADAAALLELAVASCPQDSTMRMALADVLEDLEQWDKAASVLKDQIGLYREQRSKERALVHHRLARALARAGQDASALVDLRVAAEMHPGHPAILYDLGHAALSANQLDLAEGTYRALLLALHHSIEGTNAEQASARPHRAAVFVELSEVALRRGDAARAFDLVDSAVDASFESGDDPKVFEEPLLARSRDELLARAIEHRVERAATLAARASALSDLAALWAAGLERQADLGGRIARHAERMGRELEHEGLSDAAAWDALGRAHRALGDEEARLATTQRRATLLASEIPKLGPGEERARVRLELARILLEDPAAADAALALLSGAVDDAPDRREAAHLLETSLERLGRFDELVLLLQRRIQQSPASAETAWRLGQALERSGRAREALPFYESVIDTSGADSARLEALVERLDALGSELLADALERMLATGARDATSLAERLLDLRDGAGDGAGARRALELGFAADPGNNAFFRRLVETYRAAGEPSATLKLLDPAVAARPDDADLLVLRASTRETLGDEDGALFDLETAAVADARHVGALLAMHERILSRQALAVDLPEARRAATADAYAVRVIDCLLHTTRLADARAELDRLLERNPSHTEALERSATVYAAAGEWERAAEDYERLWSIAGDGDRDRMVRVAVGLADARERAGDPGSARDWLEKALVEVPDSQDLMQRLEHVCEVTGDLARLANLLASHAERHENVAERARLFVRAGSILLESSPDATHATTALALAERARAADTASVEAVLLWATAQRRLGRPREAIAVLAETTANARGRRTALSARAHLESAKAHLALDEIVEAFDSLKAAFAADWRNAEISTLLAVVALDLDDDKLAERALSGLSATPGQRPGSAGEDTTLQANAFHRLALLAHARGDRGKAKRMANRAVGIDASHAAARVLLEQFDPPGGAANRSGPRQVIRPRS